MCLPIGTKTEPHWHKLSCGCAHVLDIGLPVGSQLPCLRHSWDKPVGDPLIQMAVIAIEKIEQPKKFSII